jgi:hypothetical protein
MNPTTYDQIITTLRGHYGDRLYRRGPVTYPFILFPTHGATVDTVLSPSVPANPMTRADYAFYHDDVIQATLARGGTLYNGTTYALDRLALNPLRLHARVGYFFDFMATCTAIELETLAGGPSTLRDKLYAHTAPATTLTSGAGRCPLIGVNTLVVFRGADGYRLLMGQRSAETAVRPNAVQVVPASAFQPAGSEPEQIAAGWNLRAHITAEYVEELFGATEAEHGGDHRTHPEALRLQAMLGEGAAQLLLTGITANLMTTHICICNLLLIHDPAWHTRLGAAALDVWETARLFMPPLDNDDALLAALPPGLHLNIAPNSAAALWPGVDAARERVYSTR